MKDVSLMTRIIIGGVIVLLLLAVMIFACSIGPVRIPFQHTMAIILDGMSIGMDSSFTERERLIVSDVRLPRVLVGVLVGAALGTAGALMQGLFRNPLVEPGYIGVSSGAAFGTVCALYFGWTAISPWLLPGAAFIRALLVVVIMKASGKKGIATLLLLGIGANSFLSALISIMVASSKNEQELRSIVYWLQGGLEARTWEHVHLTAPLIIAAVIFICLFGKELNVMLLGDDQAHNAGIHVQRLRWMLLVLASLVRMKEGE